MTEDDRKLVVVRLTQLAEAFNRTLSRETTLAYLRALDDLPGQTVLRAIDRSLRTCRRLPVPAELRELTRPDERPAPRRALPAPSDGPLVTRSSMARILREVAERDGRGDFSPTGATGRVAWMRDLADQMEGKTPARPAGGIFGQAMATIATRVASASATEREPGADDDDPTPTRWWDD